MKFDIKYVFISLYILLSSCSVFEKASRHGFESGYYKMKTAPDTFEKVYVDVTSNETSVYQIKQNEVKSRKLAFSLSGGDTTIQYPLIFRKSGLDIDITTILLKYRPAVFGLPQQMAVDFNAALYAGWRQDHYQVKISTDPLGKRQHQFTTRGYDFGFFAGPGTTAVGAFTTRNSVTNEYNGMILQFGMAGFIETNVASFGIATGFDHLFSADRNVWIYNKKPWIGFIIGIALN